jgi:hypothetical protein
VFGQEFEDLFCRVNHSIIGVKNEMTFGDELTEKQENHYECIEIYHRLLPESFKVKL